MIAYSEQRLNEPGRGELNQRPVPLATNRPITFGVGKVRGSESSGGTPTRERICIIRRAPDLTAPRRTAAARSAGGS